MSLDLFSSIIPAQPVPFWQYFDFISLSAILAVVGVLVLLQKRKTGNFMPTISQSLAHSRASQLIFSITMTLLYPLYYAFIWFWVFPTAIVPAFLYVILIIAAVFEMVFVWIPATGSIKKNIHHASFLFVGVAMFALPLLILFTAQNLTQTIVAGVLAYLSVMSFMAVTLMFKHMREYSFILEVVFCVVFLVFMSLVAHTT